MVRTQPTGRKRKTGFDLLSKPNQLIFTNPFENQNITATFAIPERRYLEL